MTVQELRDFLAMCKPDAIVLAMDGSPIVGFRTEDADGLAEVVLETDK